MRLGGDIRIVATDLDGTLLRRDGTVSPRTVRALGSAVDAGVNVVLVTARPPRWVDAIASELPCHPVAVCGNGSLTYDVQRRQLVDERPMAAEVVRQTVGLLRSELGGAAFAVEIGLSYGQEPHYQNSWRLPPNTTLASVEELVTGPISKLIVRHDDPGDPWAILERVQNSVGHLVEVTSSGPGAPWRSPPPA